EHDRARRKQGRGRPVPRARFTATNGWANQTRMLRIRPSAPLLACLSGVLGLASVAGGSAASGAAAAGVGASARAAAPFTGNPFASGPLYRAPYSNAENALKQTQQ